MLVGERMTRNPVTVTEETSIDDALHVMRERKIRRLPVLDHSGRMVGIVSDRDLLHAAPSPATSLSVYELHYLLAKLTIKRVMSSPVITVTPGTPLEEAARIMADNRIGGLPVTDDGKLVGIITETDIFKILLELLGARTPGVRVIVAVPEAKGVLAQITRALADLGANIVSVATYGGPNAGEPRIMFKLSDVAPAAVKRALAERLGLAIIDLRSV
jgi:acetoin utilization protein AcuB